METPNAPNFDATFRRTNATLALADLMTTADANGLRGYTNNPARLSEQFSTLYEQLLRDTQQQLKSGILAPVEVSRAEAEVARSRRDLAAAEQRPADYVEQILLRLRRAGIVRSTRGAHGGYQLALEPSAISIRAAPPILWWQAKKSVSSARCTPT